MCVKKCYEGDRQTQPQRVTQKTHKRGRALALNGRALSVGEEGLRISVDEGGRDLGDVVATEGAGGCVRLRVARVFDGL